MIEKRHLKTVVIFLEKVSISIGQGEAEIENDLLLKKLSKTTQRLDSCVSTFHEIKKSAK